MLHLWITVNGSESKVHQCKCFYASSWWKNSSPCQTKHVDSSRTRAHYLNTHTHRVRDCDCPQWQVVGETSPCHSKLPGEPTMTSVCVMVAEMPMLHMTSLVTSPRWLNKTRTDKNLVWKLQVWGPTCRAGPASASACQHHRTAGRFHGDNNDRSCDGVWKLHRA